ncbi:MAG TPA: carboxymuconolactone decarboxylase family protein [Candidatus Limnocylindrales bacterium]|nr:carboxymuconolactone decarboxylase family protein [Candidatus Limnocylindrales bacterium]
MRADTGGRGGRHAELPREEARLVSLSAAIAAGDAAAVAAAAQDADEDGTPPQAVYEAILQSYLFVGFPRAIEALFAARPVLERSGAIPRKVRPADPGTDLSAGEALCKVVYGKNYVKLMETMRGLSPDLASWMILEGYGKTLSRPGLSAAAREYCIVAILATTRMWRQLRSHAIGAVNVGGTRARVREAIALCEPVAGPATVQEALRVAGLESQDAGG